MRHVPRRHAESRNLGATFVSYKTQTKSAARPPRNHRGCVANSKGRRGNNVNSKAGGKNNIPSKTRGMERGPTQRRDAT